MGAPDWLRAEAWLTHTATKYANEGITSFFSGPNYILPASAGWAVVVGFGGVFAILAIFLVWVDIKFAGTIYNSEQFTTAGRSIKTGLMAVDIVSHWTWASILLQSVSYGYFYGASGAYWFAVNDALVIWLFAIIALELKHRAPKAHTMLEIVRVRWGTAAHFVFFCFAISTNLLVSVSMLQGCTSVIHALTGISIYAMAFIIPLGVVLYAGIGGLKATFTTSYMHTSIIFVVCCIFMFKVFAADGPLGSISLMYKRLEAAGHLTPISGNRQGSFLTMFSDGGLQFEVIFFFSGIAQMMVDQSYWQTAIAATPKAAVRGYFLAGFLFLGIVYSLPMCLGLAAVALGLPVTTDDALSGLVMPAAAVALLGKAGAVLVLIICFMAVTSSGAAEMVAVSSLFTFDIYRQYINPKATGTQLMIVSRLGVLSWAIVMGIGMTVVQAANININWLITIIGVFVGAAVAPLFFSLTWARCTRLAAMTGAILGTACGVASWLAYTKIKYGAVNVTTTGMNGPLLTGSIVSVVGSFILTIAITLIKPDPKPFDWEELQEQIEVVDKTVHKSRNLSGTSLADRTAAAAMKEAGALRKPVWIIVGTGFFLGLIVWPLLSLFGPNGVWTKGYFTFIVIITFIFILLASAIGIFLPLYEARLVIAAILGFGPKAADKDPTTPKSPRSTLSPKAQVAGGEVSSSDSEEFGAPSDEGFKVTLPEGGTTPKSPGFYVENKSMSRVIDISRI